MKWKNDHFMKLSHHQEVVLGNYVIMYFRRPTVMREAITGHVQAYSIESNWNLMVLQLAYFLIVKRRCSFFFVCV